MNIPLPDLEDDDDQNDYLLYSSQYNVSSVHDEKNNLYSFQSINPHVESNFPEIPLWYSHQSFPYICPETVLQLMRNEISLQNFPDGVKIVFVDCRFAYEYNAGHINTAYNLLTFDDLVSIFNSEKGNDVIIIFHCELTIDRSVKWAYIFRNYDRYCSGLPFPQLAYPNLYLMKGGFREFYNLAVSSSSNNGYQLTQGTSFSSHPMKNHFQSQVVQVDPSSAISDVICGQYLTKDDGFTVYGSEAVKESQTLFTSQIQKATLFLNKKGISI